MTTKDQPKIVVQNLSLEFQDPSRSNGKEKIVSVLKNIDLEVREGEFICIVGPSGCGKSTLLNVIGGFLKATRGQILFDGEIDTEPDPRRIFIFQENGVFPWLTVEDNIGFGLFAKSRAERERLVKHYIEMVGLTGFEKSYPREISGGMKQRVEIARALAANPDILYMDEPFGALDFLTRLHMRAELVRIWQREKKTVLFVTHDVEESVQLADRIVVLSPRPAVIRTIIENKLPRPRDLDSPDYLSTRDEIFDIMGLDHSGMSTTPDSPRSEASDAPSTFVRPGRAKKTEADADVIIVGGGPAGSVLGIYLSRIGVNHLLIDRAHHPRAHIGESLSYATNSILQELDLIPFMEQERFIRKGGVSWTGWLDREQVDLEYRGLGELDHAYQVDRAKFDDLLLKCAREHGTRIFSGSEVERVDINRHGKVSGVTVKVGSSRVSLRSRIVVDASGRGSLLGHQLKLRRLNLDHPLLSAHSWFSNVDRGKSSTASFTHIHLLPVPGGWAWQVPINDEVTSVGVVTGRDHFAKPGTDLTEFFKSTINTNPNLAERMKRAERLREFRMDGHQECSMERFAGDGWLAVGDAAFFVDPIFASGIGDAMHSAKFAATAIIEALANNDVSEAAFVEYEQTLLRGRNNWQTLVRLFNQVAPIFSRIVAKSEVRRQLQRVCEGEVYDSSAEQTLAQFEKTIQDIEKLPGVPLQRYLKEASLSRAAN